MSMPDYLRKLRKKIGNDLLLLPAAAIVAFDEQGRILSGKHIETEKWLIPGGIVEPYEFPADTAVREMWEETGLLVEPIRVIGVYGGPEFHVTYANQDEVSYLATVFEGRVVDGEIRPDGDEFSELAYFSQHDLAELALPPWMPIVLDAVFGGGSGTHFETPTWKPPANGIRKGGMSDYIRQVRKKIGNDMLVMPAVGGVIFNKQGHLLLQQRSDDGQWHPPAGAIDPHESPADAVVREVWEETGLLVEPTRVTGIYNGTEFYLTYPHGDQCAVFSIMFECCVIGGQMSPDGIESLDVRYFDLKNLAGNFLPERWQRRVADAVNKNILSHFDQPTWQPSAAL